MLVRWVVSVALAAHKRLQRSSKQQQVRSKLLPGGLAQEAPSRDLARVGPPVRGNGALLAEPPGAHRATIWLVAGVGPLVRRNLALLAEPPKNMGHRDPGGKSIEQDYGFSPAACVRPVVKMPRGQGRGNVGLTFSDSGGGGLPQPTLCSQFRPRRVRLDRHSLKAYACPRLPYVI